MDVLAYERYLEENILELRDVLKQGLYQHGLYVPFTIWIRSNAGFIRLLSKIVLFIKRLLVESSRYLNANSFTTVIPAVRIRALMLPSPGYESSFAKLATMTLAPSMR